jgi:hypothetical protein
VHLSPKEIDPGTHCRGDSVSSRAGLVAVQALMMGKANNSYLFCNNVKHTNNICRPNSEFF